VGAATAPTDTDRAEALRRDRPQTRMALADRERPDAQVDVKSARRSGAHAAARRRWAPAHGSGGEVRGRLGSGGGPSRRMVRRQWRSAARRRADPCCGGIAQPARRGGGVMSKTRPKIVYRPVGLLAGEPRVMPASGQEGVAGSRRQVRTDTGRSWTSRRMGRDPGRRRNAGRRVRRGERPPWTGQSAAGLRRTPPATGRPEHVTAPAGPQPAVLRRAGRRVLAGPPQRMRSRTGKWPRFLPAVGALGGPAPWGTRTLPSPCPRRRGDSGCSMTAPPSGRTR